MSPLREPSSLAVGKLRAERGGGRGGFVWGGCTRYPIPVSLNSLICRWEYRTYRTLPTPLPRIANMIRRQLDGSLVGGGKELFGKGNFRHDDALEGGVERVVFGKVRQFDDRISSRFVLLLGG